MEKEKEKDKTCEFIIVTGMSGSGKTQACRYLEDIGYFVVDNLPPVFIPKFAELCQQSGGSINQVVLVVDTRSREFFDTFTHVLEDMDRDNQPYVLLFMDASDAADYVQELAGESASIIFGAMYDDTKSDECTITVIATGLHNVGGSASKLKARLEGQQKTSSILPNGVESHARPSYDYTAQRTAQTSTVRPQGGTMPTLQPRSTTGGVREQSIKIPDFFKK